MPKIWQDAIRNMTFVDAAVIDRNTVAFTLVPVDPDEPHKPPKSGRNKTLVCDIPSGIWSGKHYELGAFHLARCAGGRTPDGQPIALFADAGANVTTFVLPDGPRTVAAQEMPTRGTARVRFVGTHFYSCGLDRGFLRRDGPGEWTVISEQKPKDEQGRRVGNYVALDGLTDDDLFLALQKNSVTTHAEVHHWDGEHITAIPLPADVTDKHRNGHSMLVTDLTVDPDGRVYVSGADGELLVGGRDGFVSVTGPDRPRLRVNQIRWFKDTLYGAHGMGLFRFDFEELRWVGAPFVGDPEAPSEGSAHIDANEDLLVYAGAYSANVYDGERWTRIAGSVSPLDVTRLQLKEQQVEDLADLRDVMRDLSKGD